MTTPAFCGLVRSGRIRAAGVGVYPARDPQRNGYARSRSSDQEISNSPPQLLQTMLGTGRPSGARPLQVGQTAYLRSEEHTSELQSLAYLVCRLLLEKKKEQMKGTHAH